jgi:hypothetical protein
MATAHSHERPTLVGWVRSIDLASVVARALAPAAPSTDELAYVRLSVADLTAKLSSAGLHGLAPVVAAALERVHEQTADQNGDVGGDGGAFNPTVCGGASVATFAERFAPPLLPDCAASASAHAAGGREPAAPPPPPASAETPHAREAAHRASEAQSAAAMAAAEAARTDERRLLRESLLADERLDAAARSASQLVSEAMDEAEGRAPAQDGRRPPFEGAHDWRVTADVLRAELVREKLVCATVQARAAPWHDWTRLDLIWRDLT